MLDLLVPTFKQPVKNDDASIIEVLKYSQKDMDAALARAREEASALLHLLCGSSDAGHVCEGALLQSAHSHFAISRDFSYQNAS